MNIMRRCMWRQWISYIRKGWLEEIHWSKGCIGTWENLNKIKVFSCTPLSDPFLIYAVYPHFSQLWFLVSSCNSLLCLFNLLLTLSTELLVNEYLEKIYVKTVNKPHQKGVTLILGFQPTFRLMPNIRLDV